MLFNGILFLTDIGVVLLNRRKPAAWVLLVTLLAFGIIAVGLSATLAEDIFHMAAMLAAALFLHTVAILASLAIIYSRVNRRVGNLFNLVAFGILFVGVWAFILEPQRFETTTYTLESDKVSRPVKILILADIQTDRVSDYERTVLAAGLAEDPDLIFLPGDYIQLANPDAYRREADRLNLLLHDLNFSAPLGVYAVTGNVDPPVESERVFAGLEVVYFQSVGRAALDELVITGLPLAASYDVNFAVEPEEKFHIVLGHNPNFALGDIQADLLVAGHTHGGQVQLPLIGPLFTLSEVPRKWAAGALTEIAPERWLVVSRGIGMERHNAPRLRFLAPPEIVIVNLVPRK